MQSGYILNRNVDEGQQNQVVVEKGEYFGLVGFMLGRQFIARAQSLDYSTVLRLSRRKVELIVQNNTKDRETFMEIRDRVLYSNDFSHLYIKCAYCQSKKHLSQDCYLLHFDKSNPFIRFKDNYSPKQERSKYNGRGKQRSLNALKMHKLIINNIEELRSNYGLKSSQRLEESELSLMNESFVSKRKHNNINQSISEQEDDDEDQEQGNQNIEERKDNLNSIFLDESDYEQKTENDMQDQDTLYLQSRRNKKSVRKDKFEVSKQQKSLKDLIPKYKEEEMNGVNQIDQSLNEFKIKEQQQQQHQENNIYLGYTTDVNKCSQQSLYSIKLKDMDSNLQIQQGTVVSKIINKPTPLTDRVDELYTYDLIDEELNTRISIKNLPSNILSKGKIDYFHQDEHSFAVASKITPQESILKKQSPSHQPNLQQLVGKYKHNASKNLDKQNSVINTNKKKKKHSLQNSVSLNHTSSLAPTHSAKDTRTNVGSKKDSVHSKKISKLSQSSGMMSHLKFENSNLQNQITCAFDEEDESYREGLSEKQVTKPQQRQMNQNRSFYWYFDKIQNYQFYFTSANYENQINKFNQYYQQKKAKVKSKAQQNQKRDKH